MSGLPELKFRMGADTSGVEKGGARAKRSIQDVDASFADMAKRAAKFGASLAAAWATFKTAAIAAGVTAAKTAVEIDNLSRVANTNTTEFQKWAIAAKTVGVEQDKLSDILKDITDRVGEFLSTGGGPMKDFFENVAPMVGVTADQFARLSGPEALQLYVTSLEKAGLSQQQMTFYLEGMSGDLTRLLPLLRNGGAEIRKLGDAAEATGKILDEDMIRGGVELDKIFGEISDTLRTSATKAVLEHKDELIALANWISDTVIPAISDLFGWISETAQRLAPAIEAWRTLGGVIGAALGLEGGYEVPGHKPNTPEDNERGREGEDTSNTGAWPLDKNGNVIFDDGSVLETNVPAWVPPVPKGKSGGGGKKGGGRKSDRAEKEFERISQQYMTEQELLDEHLATQLEKLAEFRAAKLAGEEELADLEQKIRQDHHDKMRQIDQAALQLRLGAWGDAFGDLSSLMSSENKKLFAIGKAAAMAQGMVDGWSAAISAWDKGMKIGGPPAAAAFAGMSVLRTGVMLSNIAGASANGGGSSMSGSGAGGSAPSVPAQSSNKVANYQISGDVLGKQSTEALFRQINEGVKDGYTIHNVEWV